ncbi:hypothetical protein GCM10028821_12810 [Hymenobacter jeollabukensis]
MPAAGFAVPIDGIKYRALLLGFFPVHSHNSLSPQLLLYPTHLVIKVIGTSQYEYKALREVGYRPEQFLSRAKVELRFTDGARYYLTVSYPSVERQLLQFFYDLEAPLSGAALRTLEAPAT